MENIKNLAIAIIDSKVKDERLNHCIDILFECDDIDYDHLLVTIELILKEGYYMKERVEQRLAKNKSRAVRESMRMKLKDIDKSLFIESMNDSILSAALQAFKKDE